MNGRPDTGLTGFSLNYLKGLITNFYSQNWTLMQRDKVGFRMYERVLLLMATELVLSKTMQRILNFDGYGLRVSLGKCKHVNSEMLIARRQFASVHHLFRVDAKTA